MTHYLDGYIDGYHVGEYETCDLPPGTFSGTVVDVIKGRIQAQMRHVGLTLPGTFTIMRKGVLVGYCKLRGHIGKTQGPNTIFMRWFGLTSLAPPQVGDIVSSL